MAYIALYRKWRPKTFTDVVGQSQVSDTLMRAIRENKVAHAYLFAGPRGTGKTSLAKIFARAMNCVHGPTDTPCNECEQCLHILNGDSMDVIEIDAASNRGIDEIRALRENAKFLPVDGRKKIFIIDEAHMLTTEAWNALLKTIEEPPEHVMFIFATTELEKLPVTIISRCQRYTFRRISVEDMTKHLMHVAKESNIEIDQAAAQLIAVQADGGLRDALSILDQCSGMTQGKITPNHVIEMMGLVGKNQVIEFYEALCEGNGALILEAIQRYMSEGREPIQIIEALSEHIRCLLLYKVLPKAEELKVYQEQSEKFIEQSNRASVENLDVLMHRLQKIQVDSKLVDNPRLIIEMGLLALCATVVNDEKDIDSRLSVVELNQQRSWTNVVERITELEDKVKNGIPIQESSIDFAKPNYNKQVETREVSTPKVLPKQNISNDNIVNTVPNTSSVNKDPLALAKAFSAAAKGEKVLNTNIISQPINPVVNEPVVNGQVASVDSMENNIVSPKEYRSTTKYIIETLMREGNTMQGVFLKHGSLIYLDDRRIVFTFNRKTSIDILMKEPGYSIVKKTICKILHKQISLDYIEDSNPLAERYKEAALAKLKGVKVKPVVEEKVKPQVQKQEINVVETNAKPQIKPIAVENNEKPKAIAQDEQQTIPYSSFEDDFDIVPVEGFDAPIPDDEYVDDAEYNEIPPVEYDDFPIEAVDSSFADHNSVNDIPKTAQKCGQEHVSKMAENDPAFAKALSEISKNHDIYVEVIDD